MRASAAPTDTEILQARARTLARPVAAPAPAAGRRDLVVFGVGGERYGVPSGHVVEVLPPPELTPVPCTPPAILGVVNHRGRLVAVLHLGPLLQGSLTPPGPGGCLVVVEHGPVRVALLADEVAGVGGLDPAELAPPPAAAPGAGPPLVAGVAPGMVAVLDVPALLADPRIVVNEEVP